MIYTLLITAFSVSIDSFFCGFSLSLMGGKKLPVILSIFLTVLVMCSSTNYAALFIADSLTLVASIIGGSLLILIGLYNLFKNQTAPDSNVRGGLLKTSFLSGLAVGTDGAIANLSLSLMGINAFFVPLTIALFHAITIYLGIILAQTKLAKRLNKFCFLAPLILIGLGIYKIVSMFV